MARRVSCCLKSHRLLCITVDWRYVSLLTFLALLRRLRRNANLSNSWRFDSQVSILNRTHRKRPRSNRPDTAIRTADQCKVWVGREARCHILWETAEVFHEPIVPISIADDFTVPYLGCLSGDRRLAPSSSHLLLGRSLDGNTHQLIV